MIDFKSVWLPQILGYASLISDEDALRASWIENDRSRTSVTDFDELIEQIFDDLDSEHMLNRVDGELPNDAALADLLKAFVGSIARLDEVLPSRVDMLEPATLLQTQEWLEVREASQNLLSYTGERYPKPATM